MKKLSIYVILGVLAVSSILIFKLNGRVAVKNHSDNITPVVTSFPTSTQKDAKTFISKEKAITFEYPGDWNLITDPNIALYSFDYKTSEKGLVGGYVALFVGQYNAQKPLTDYYNNQNTDYIVSNKREIKVDGYPALQYSVQSPQTKEGLLIAKDNTLYRFEVNYNEAQKIDIMTRFTELVNSINFL